MNSLQRYEVLDGLRGVCALFVCILHARIFSHLYDLEFIRHTYLFVDFFFVLSGFVICVSYQHKINHKEDLYKFIIKRIGRIWPLHLLMIVVLLGIELSKYLLLSQASFQSGSEAFSGRFSLEALMSNILLIHSLGIHNSLTWNNPSWSISVEFFSYLVFALLLLAFKTRLKSLALAVALLSLLTLLLIAPVNMDVTYDYGLLRCFSGFFIGVFIYLWRKPQLILSAYMASFIEGMLVIFVCLFVSLCGDNYFSLCSPLVFGVTVWFFSYELGGVSKLLKNSFIQLMGSLSFTMYMIHSVLLTVIWRIGHLLDNGSGDYIVDSPLSHGYKTIIDLGGRYVGDVFLLVYLALVMFVSSVIYKVFEDPLRIKFNHFANKGR